MVGAEYMSCLVCGGVLSPLFETRDYRRPAELTTYVVDWCTRCRYGSVRGKFTPQAIAAFYAVPYYTHGSEQANERARSFFDRARVHIGWKADAGVSLGTHEAVGKSLLDLGCGDGENLRKFSDAGFLTTGVEPDPTAREVALKHGRVYPGTAEQLPVEIATRKFDTVLLSHVLEHCQNPRTALMNIHSLVAPGGRVILEVPNSDALAFWRYKQCWPWTDVPRHLHFFSEHSLASLLDQCGFRVTTTLFLGYVRQFQPQWITWQQHIEEALHPTTRDARRESWRLLFRTMFGPARRKYDSIRVHAEIAR